MSSIRFRRAVITGAVALFAISIIALVVGMSVAGAQTATGQPQARKQGEIKSPAVAYAADHNRESGAIVIEQTTRRILYGENENARLFPASTTKVLTALVVLNKLPVETVITIPKQAVGIEGSSIYLKEGEKLTVADLLYGMMLRSGNDAATALALAVSQSLEAFSDLMNNTAMECGATSSHFINPHGLHDDNHYTTAKDLALICAKAFDNDFFKKVVSTKIATIGEGESRRVIGNKNKMLNMFEGANGVKTGFTKNSGRCLVSSANRDGMQLIAVVLNHGNMWNDSIRMLESTFNCYEMKPIELAQFISGNGTEILELEVGFDNNGEYDIKMYPLKKDGSEKIKIVPVR